MKLRLILQKDLPCFERNIKFPFIRFIRQKSLELERIRPYDLKSIKLAMLSFTH